MKTTTMVLTADNIFSGITKLHPEQGDVYIFHMKTDKYGVPICNIDSAQEQLKAITDSKVGTILAVITDKFYLYSVGDAEKAIKELMNLIQYIQEQSKGLGDIEITNSDCTGALINAEDPSLKSH